MKKLLAVFLIFALLFAAGCNKAKDETPDTPDVPDTPADNTPVTPHVPDAPISTEDPPQPIYPPPGFTPDLVTATLIDASEEWLEELAAERQAVKEFLQGELPDGTVIETVLDANPLEGEGWRVTVQELSEGQPTLARYTARIIPDGKDFHLDELIRTEQSAAWQAVQNYRALYSALTTDTTALLRMLGFDPESGLIFYSDFVEAMQNTMTRNLYNTYWAGYFDSKDAGLLTWKEASGDGIFYAVDRVELQPDGSWLSFEHYYDADGVRYDYMVRVELSAQNDGRYVVEKWDAQNANVYDRNSDGAIQAREFPRPTGEAMGLTGEDAALYTVISANLLDYPENADFGNDLVLTSVDLLGKYEGENGQIHYVCRLNDSHFYDAGNVALQYSSMGSLGRIARVTLNADGTLAEFLPTLDGADNTTRLTEIFGPLTAQREALEKNQIIPGARRLLPTGETLLVLYKAAYFPGI